VIDAALLLDWGMDRELNFILVIHSGLETRLKRLARRGITRADALARQRAQRPFSEYRRRADRVMLNSGTPADLKRKLLKLWNKLTG
jgi:dephospho-CoA kinase